MTIGDLAQSCGLHRNTIANLELGNRKVDPDTIDLVVKTLQIHGVDLFRDGDEAIGVKVRISDLKGRP